MSKPMPQDIAGQVEDLCRDISRKCEDLQHSVRRCRQYMPDPRSEKLLEKGWQTASNIKACLFPVQRLLDQDPKQLGRVQAEMDR